MIETITLDTSKCYSPSGKLRISPLRRGERNNVALTVPCTVNDVFGPAYAKALQG